MIKFFRKIRQNLLMENKTSTYFTYAIGEIVLVVIGILIALQINNWNESRKAKENEIVLLTKLKEENLLNINSIEDQLEFRKSIPEKVDKFIVLLGKGNLENNNKNLKNQFKEILRTAAYTFIQSNLINYINEYNSRSTKLSKELAKLEFYQTDLQLSSTKGLDLKIKYVFESLENDIDFISFKIISYKHLESLKFKNNMILLSELESEISTLFIQTYNQMKKVDDLITERLKSI